MALKRKKKLKNNKDTVGLAKIASFTTNSISSAFSNYKKNKELNKIKAIKLQKLEERNSLLKERSRSRPFILIDLHSAFTDDEGLLDERFTTDGVHLNSSGYDNWVKFIHKDVSSIKVRPF